MQRSSGTEHLSVLDGLRALAILGVVAVHVGQILPQVDGALGNLLDYGARGVQLFFVVSGFTLALRYSSVDFSFRQFLWRRYLRIAPMFYVGMVLYLALGRGLGWGFEAGSASALDIVTAATFTHGWLPETINGVVPGGWSIAAEATFYLTFPVILLLIGRPRLFALFAGASVVVAAASLFLLRRFVPGDADTAFSFYFWLSQYPAFVFGCGLVWLVPWLEQRVGIARTGMGLSVVGLAALSQAQFPGSYFVTDALFAVLVASSVVLSPRVLSSAVMVSIGRTSYSIYIMHFAIVAMVGWAIQTAPVVEKHILLAVCYAVVFLISWCISTLTYRFIELPAMRAGKRLGRVSPSPNPAV